MGSYKFNTDIAFGENEAAGKYVNGSSRKASDTTEREIELEIKAVVDECYAEVQTLLKSKKDELQKLAAALVEKETLYFRDIVEILEPTKSSAEIEAEIAALSERKFVGKRPVISLDIIEGLASAVKSKGSNGGGNGSSGPGAIAVEPENNEKAPDQNSSSGQVSESSEFGN